ncbi:MAG TPA: hypothetical protein VK689_20470, partial [Armatimonadota bacterium]|nr:hypothetical protein [Armatimonadota bacterium]
RERMIALESSSLLNGAYRTLRDPFERAAYLLRLEEGDADGGGAKPPADLFEEILEIQELLAEFKSGEPEDGVLYRPQLASRRDTLQAEQDGRSHLLTDDLFQQWDALQDKPHPDTRDRSRILQEIRRIIDERAYLRRVLNSLNEALAPGSEGVHGGEAGHG